MAVFSLCDDFSALEIAESISVCMGYCMVRVGGSVLHYRNRSSSNSTTNTGYSANVQDSHGNASTASKPAITTKTVTTSKAVTASKPVTAKPKPPAKPAHHASPSPQTVISEAIHSALNGQIDGKPQLESVDVKAFAGDDAASKGKYLVIVHMLAEDGFSTDADDR